MQAGAISEYVFGRPDGQPIYLEVICDYVKRLGKRIGVAKMNVHMLRHTVASLLLAEGENPKIVQELLGHSSIRVTIDVYGHVISGLKENAVNKIAGIVMSGVKSGVYSAAEPPTNKKVPEV